MLLFYATLGIAASWAFGQGVVSAGSALGKPLPSENFTYHDVLEENYELYWEFNDTHIVFETHVKTHGYVGFGISPNGGMAGSDIVIGWVKDGKAYFKDRYANGNSVPDVDASQDWFLLSAAEIGEYTVLKMVRKLDTCDPVDRAILVGTTRVIYSYSSVDPTSDANVPYHGSVNRGAKSLLLLDPPSDDKDAKTPSENVITVDFLSRNYSVPGRGTTYHDYTYKLMDLGQKHHVIKFEPIIQKGHEKLVHHMVLYYCNRPLNDSLVGLSFETENSPEGVHGVCEDTMIAWAVGGSPYDFPPHVGLSLGAPQDPVYFRLETHYNNPDMRTDFVDNSGIRLHLTTDLRQHDAGVVMLGLNPDKYHIVPAHEGSFLSRGYCQADCIGETIGDQEVHVFAAFLHAHLLGKKIRARHFRNGVELPPLSEDNNYDFDFQQTRDVSPEVTIRKGDSVINECEYDSSARSDATYGGLSTQNEMCLAFLYYYPKTRLANCLSRFNYDKLPAEYSSKNETIFDVVNHLDWTKTDDREKFHRVLNDSSILMLCSENPDGKYYAKPQPQPRVPEKYQVPSKCTGK
ncbi:hypothetical protein BsWGS_08945 [Bradybaena similaris]